MNKFSKIVVLGLCLFLLIGMLAGCGQQQQSQAPSEKESQSEQGSQQPAEEKKVLVVGTSPDYPPFEYVDENNEYVGFDIAYIQEVGKRLGMEIKIEALQFESLIAALKQGKIDLIISCMSPTPDRLKEVDFTDTYYETLQAVIAKPDSGVEVKSLDDLKNYDFAVQTGTTMDEWATKQVQEGKLKDSQVHRYSDVNAGVLDLKNGRVQAFLMDGPVAYEKAKELGLEVLLDVDLETSADPAIAVPKGSELKDKLNQIIKEIKEDGTLEKLENQWIKLQ